MGRKRKSPEKSQKRLGRKARKQQPPEIPEYLKEAKGSYGVWFQDRRMRFMD